MGFALSNRSHGSDQIWHPVIQLSQRCSGFEGTEALCCAGPLIHCSSMTSGALKLLVRNSILGSLVLILAACASTVGVGGGSGSFVSTTISNSSAEAVDAAVKSVFREEGFSLLRQSSKSYYFQKWGGRSAEIIYGSWFTEGVAVEPEVIVFDKGAGNFTVHCDVYMREHNGSELLDSDWQLMGAGKVAYNGLMKKIKERAENR